MLNSAPIAGRAMLIDEAMKGGRKDVRVAMISTQLLAFELAQISIGGLNY
jgi:hypothetical protein